MEIGDLLSKEELSAIKGGEWHYDEETDEWYWIEDGRKVLCPQENPRQSKIVNETVIDYDLL